MAVYKVKMRSGELVTVEDGRDLTILSATLCEQGFILVERRISDYAPVETTHISLLERAVDSIELN